MKLNKSLLLAALLLPLAVSASAKRIVMTIDTFDEIGLCGERMTPGHITRLMHTAKTSGVDRVLWRVAGLGVAGYPSKRLANGKWLATADRSVIASRTKGGIPQSERFSADSPLDRTLAAMDPISVARRAARTEGVEFYLWVDLVDEQNGRFLIENPDCLVKSSAGKPWPGVRDYSNPKAVAEKLEEIEELLPYGPDGLYLSWSCHSCHLDFPEPDGDFGVLKGAHMTEFLRQLRKRPSMKGVRILMGTPFGGTVNLNSPYMSANNKYRIELEWRKWIDEGLVDGLALGDYEWTWDGVPNWTLKGLKREDCRPGHEPADAFGPEYVAYNRGRVELLYFSSWLSAYAQHHQGASAKDLPEAMRMRTDTVVKTGADGMILHEAHTFEYYNGFGTIAEMRRAFDAESEKVKLTVTPLDASKVKTDRMEIEFFVNSSAERGMGTAVATLFNVDNGQKYERTFPIAIGRGVNRHWSSWGGEPPYHSEAQKAADAQEGLALDGEEEEGISLDDERKVRKTAEPEVPDGFYIAQVKIVGGDGKLLAEKRYSNDELTTMRIQGKVVRKIAVESANAAAREIEAWNAELLSLREKAVAAGADTSRPDILLAALKETLRQQKGRLNSKEYNVVVANRDYCARKVPQVKAELERLVADPKSGKPAGFLPTPKGRLGVKDGYFTTPDGKPVFLLGQCLFAIWPDLDIMHSFHYNLVHIGEHIDTLFPDAASEEPCGELVIADGNPKYDLVKFLDKCQELGIKVDLGLTARPPKWFFEKHPDAKLKGHSVAGFVPFDIESPETYAWVEKYFAAIMPKIANHPALNCIWLANEPTYYNLGPRAEKLFRETVGDSCGTFAFPPKENTPAYAAYWKFNIGRLNRFMAFMRDCVRKYDKTVYTCYKLNNLQMGWYCPLPNCDQEGLSDLGELVGMDSGTFPFAKPYYDWLRCLSPEKPMVNLEFKGGGARSKLDIWNSAMFGLAGNDVWCWHANPRFSGTMCYTEALCEITEAMAGIQRHIDIVADFQKMPRAPFAVMYPDPVIPRSKEYFAVHTPVVYALRDLGFTPDYVTEKRLADGALERYGYRTLLLPSADYMKKETVEAIGKWIAKGGRAVVIGNPPSRDPLGRPLTPDWTASVTIPACEDEAGYCDALAKALGEDFKPPLFIPDAMGKSVYFRTIARKDAQGRDSYVSYILSERCLDDIVLEDIRLVAPAVEATDLTTGEKVDLAHLPLRRWDFRLIEWRTK